MITKTIGNQTIVFYASIKEMPIKLYNLTQRYLLQDMGIGSDMQAIDEHFKSLDAFLAAGKLDDAKTERENMRFAFYTILEQVNYKSLAFGCHIFSIDKVEVTDRSEEALAEMVNNLPVSLSDIEDVLAEVKKKLQYELTTYFPAWFSESDLNYLEKLKKYLQARINFELTQKPEYLAEIIKCSDYFLESNKPKCFNPFLDNDIIRLEQEFESMCAALEENGVAEARNMSVYEFYSRVKYFEKKSKK